MRCCQQIANEENSHALHIACHLGILLAIWVSAAITAIPQAAAADQDVYIVNSRTRMVADVYAFSTDNGSPVVLWTYGGTPNQQFTLQRLPPNFGYQPVEEQWFLLRARHSGKCLKTAGYQSGAPVVQSECIGEAAQMWRVRQVRMTTAECPSGRCFAAYREVLENAYDRGRRCLDAANAKFPAPPAQRAPLQAWNCIPKFSAPNFVNQEFGLVNVQDWGFTPVVR